MSGYAPGNYYAIRCHKCGEHKHGMDLDLDDVAATSPKAKAELEELRAENARLRADVAKWQSLAEGFEKACNSAIGKRGILAKANRYVWLRDECIESKNPQHTLIVEAPPDMWDEEIDKAMGEA